MPDDDTPATTPTRRRTKAAGAAPAEAPATAVARRRTAPAARRPAAGDGRAAPTTSPGAVAILAADGSPIVGAEANDGAGQEALELSRGAIGRLEAHDVAVNLGAVGQARAERVSVQMGALGFALTSDLEVHQGIARTVVAREAHLEQSAARVVVAQDVHMERGSTALVILAQRVDGQVRALLDWRGAIALGVAFGLVVRLFRRSGRRG